MLIYYIGAYILYTCLYTTYVLVYYIRAYKCYRRVVHVQRLVKEGVREVVLRSYCAADQEGKRRVKKKRTSRLRAIVKSWNIRKVGFLVLVRYIFAAAVAAAITIKTLMRFLKSNAARAATLGMLKRKEISSRDSAKL